MQKNGLSFPRYQFRRKILRIVGRFLIRLLTRFEIEGWENLPEKGPYIIAANHVAAMEGMLMALFSPDTTEILGSNDIPLDPNLAPFAKAYGYIPINRGAIDQEGLKMSLSVLEQEGIIGIFPEGGIWESGLKEAKVGVSWLAYKANVRVIPVGFIGMQGALKNMLHLKFPQIKMRVGNSLTPETLFNNQLPLKMKLQHAADEIMKAVADLLPQEEKNQPKHVTKKENLVEEIVAINDKGGRSLLEFPGCEDFKILISHPVIMDIFKRNLRMNVGVLMERNKELDISRVMASSALVRDYLNQNPGFLNYRFGSHQGIEMRSAVISFYNELQSVYSSAPEAKIIFKS